MKKRYFKLEDAAQYQFYWRKGNRVEIENLLKTHSDGSFLIRLARDQSLCLSLKYHKGSLFFSSDTFLKFR